jgi:hypothetical protein
VSVERGVSVEQQPLAGAAAAGEAPAAAAAAASSSAAAAPSASLGYISMAADVENATLRLDALVRQNG